VRIADFDYDLPQHLIAQQPAEPRDASRLMVIDRAAGTLEHRRFRDLPAFLHRGDALVLNDTKVIPARLAAAKVPSGGKVEILLLRREAERTWEALVGGRRVGRGARLRLRDGSLAKVLEARHGGVRLLRFETPIRRRLKALGSTPLPPYIHETGVPAGRYQTVFARVAGSAAAPTAGMHFTPELLARLRRRGVSREHVTLHIGLDTFAPVVEPDPVRHTIHREWCRLRAAAAARLEKVRRRGGRIVAVGTTAVRALESASRSPAPGRLLSAWEGFTDLFILPGFRFRCVDALITNFHLPRSTLLMLVCAFAGRDLVWQAYETAKAEGYRFYSFGDAMLIL
jgi:S-adenosylmethionine:tRNA ribosyltransferase-isomerase